MHGAVSAAGHDGVAPAYDCLACLFPGLRAGKRGGCLGLYLSAAEN